MAHCILVFLFLLSAFGVFAGSGLLVTRLCCRCCLTSRRSQPPLARSVPLSRFTSRVGGGSAFFVRLKLLILTTMPLSQPCPHCNSSETVSIHFVVARRALAMIQEIAMPWKILWNILSPLARQAAQKMTVVRKEYICSACSKLCFVCPKCENTSRLYEGPTQASTITCETCNQQSVYRLD